MGCIRSNTTISGTRVIRDVGASKATTGDGKTRMADNIERCMTSGNGRKKSTSIMTHDDHADELDLADGNNSQSA